MKGLQLSKGFFLYAIVLVACCFKLAVGAEDQDSKRIVGGIVAAEGQFPYAAGLLSNTFSSPFCGGTIITPQVVLTAAHCTSPNFIKTGCVNVNDNDCDVIGVASTFTHPNYNRRTLAFDFQILYLEEPVSAPAGPVAFIANEDWQDIDAGTTVRTIGWGRTSENGNVSPDLRFVDVETLSNAACAADYAPTGLGVQNNMICAALPGKDSCNGDSGGPLVVSCDQGDILIGDVSWGLGCADPRYPGVYGRVSSAYPWIAETLGSLNELQNLATPPDVSSPCAPSGGPTAPTPLQTPFPTPSPTDPFFCQIFPFLC